MAIRVWRSRVCRELPHQVWDNLAPSARNLELADQPDSALSRERQVVSAATAGLRGVRAALAGEASARDSAAALAPDSGHSRHQLRQVSRSSRLQTRLNNPFLSPGRFLHHHRHHRPRKAKRLIRRNKPALRSKGGGARELEEEPQRSGVSSGSNPDSSGVSG